MGAFVSQDAIQLLPVTATTRKKQSELPPRQASLAIAAQQLVQLNLQFLTLPIISGLPDLWRARIRDMSAAQRLSTADCRFSLFTLAFDDCNRWLPLLSQNAVNPGHQARNSRGKESRMEFVSAAVFLAWHLVQNDVLAGKFLLHIDDAVAAALKNVPIAHLVGVSVGACEWLAPRWANHPCFWSALLHPSGDSGNALVATKLLGRQLLAAESLNLRAGP